jgi:hypothetical protein
MRRSLDELINTQEPGLDFVRELIAEATNSVEILPCAPADGARTLLAMQVTTRSPMGAIAHGTGGLLVDHGWVRVLGAGCPRLPRDLATWNRIDQTERRLPGALLVGDDAIGGFFALNGGALPGPLGNLHYFAPDSLEWEDMGDSYSGWLQLLFEGDLGALSERWPGWAVDSDALAGDRAFSIAPPLWAQGPPIGERDRRAVPVDELWWLQQDVGRQLQRGAGA